MQAERLYTSAGSSCSNIPHMGGSKGVKDCGFSFGALTNNTKIPETTAFVQESNDLEQVVCDLGVFLCACSGLIPCTWHIKVLRAL